MDKTEQETEIHRTQKALKKLLNQRERTNLVRFDSSDVNISVPLAVARTFGGQVALALLVNLLARMKTIINRVAISLPWMQASI